MSSIKQEVAAILMDYTDKIPEQVYMDILNKLGEIPDHKDPKKAIEIQKELNETKENLSMMEDERDLLIEEVQGEKELREEWQRVGSSLAFICEKIFNKKAKFDGNKVIYDISCMDEVDRNINKVNGFLNNLEEWRKDHTTKVDESFIYSESTFEEHRNSLYVSGDEEDEIEDSDIEFEDEPEKDGEDVDMFSTIPEIDDSQFQENDEETICGFSLCYLIDEINTVFNGKVHNYYGAILLHEDNCWTNQLKSINSFKIHHTKKKQMREMKYQDFQKKKSQWHHSDFNVVNNLCNVEYY